MSGTHFIKTRPKTPSEVDEFHHWMDMNFIQYSYLGGLTYAIEGDGDATAVKLHWGYFAEHDDD